MIAPICCVLDTGFLGRQLIETFPRARRRVTVSWRRFDGVKTGLHERRRTDVSGHLQHRSSCCRLPLFIALAAVTAHGHFTTSLGLRWQRTKPEDSAISLRIVRERHGTRSIRVHDVDIHVASRRRWRAAIADERDPRAVG